jgi:hypothetical protein
MKDYELNLKEWNGSPSINFANNTDEFVEVVFTIGDIEVKTGKKYSGEERGYCYPDHYERNIKEMARNVHIDRDSQIKAYIYKGTGKMKESDFDMPIFIRRKLGQETAPENKKAAFRRSSDSPSAIISLS